MKKLKMKLKDRLAFDSIDDFDDCANGSECIASQVQAAWLAGFAKRGELDLLAYEDAGGKSEAVIFDLKNVGEEEE